ncbi:MAG: hypothetical protein AAGE83_07970, partial [Pseudomonadota bacterium]
RPLKMQFLGNGDEGAKLSKFHGEGVWQMVDALVISPANNAAKPANWRAHFLVGSFAATAASAMKRRKDRIVLLVRSG